jgi:hypothetical protein
MTTIVTEEEIATFEAIRAKMQVQEQEKIVKFSKFMESPVALEFISEMKDIEAGCVTGSVAYSQMGNIIKVIEMVKSQFPNISNAAPVPIA